MMGWIRLFRYKSFRCFIKSIRCNQVCVLNSLEQFRMNYKRVKLVKRLYNFAANRLHYAGKRPYSDGTGGHGLTPLRNFVLTYGIKNS